MIIRCLVDAIVTFLIPFFKHTHKDMHAFIALRQLVVLNVMMLMGLSIVDVGVKVGLKYVFN